ncbi:ABC transporter permease [Anaerosacchariphilus sp. NSJ-68]|uniref:ABC transporter permease n=2 Tax=Lachnospiraceae TaxID=186803 RepID=A0A923LBH9_9FIRM|nr:MULTISPECIES: ABC transporter permease [Lachnospiraceae]MBC5659159.1 ABC transporter permease [Anaerosacchariphilus hominis]MBC5696825.1 ABC transporter permease [Roseburia difficilis]
MERLKFIGKRLIYLVVMLFGVATLVFILTKMIPGDPTVANLSQRALNDPQVVAAYRAKYGLDQPVFVQYILYIKNLLHLDLGTSIRTNKPVLDELARCYPATIELALFAIILAALLGILFGVISAIKRNSILDQVVRALSVTGVSIPSFWFALLVLYFFYYKLHIFPGPGRLSNSFSAPATVTGMYVIDSLIEGNPAKALDALQHLILPGLVLAAFTMGLITRTTRSNLLDVMSTDYIRTARAKGLSRVGLIVRHALGNVLIPVLTVIGLGLGNLLGGMVLVETIFNWPGVGQFAYESVLSVDYPSIIGVALLIALNYMVINTVVDILYGVIDPRVRCNG